MSLQKSPIGILGFGQIKGRAALGSTLIRAKWLVQHWPGAEHFVIGKLYDAVIFQKAYWIEYARAFPGCKILDICDPDFLDWNSPCLDMAHECDWITTSTQALADIISLYTPTPVMHIPDRIDVSYFQNHERKTHSGAACVAGWFGYSKNFPSLVIALPDLASAGYSRLVVITDEIDAIDLSMFEQFGLHTVVYRWDPKTAFQLLLKVDVVINYRLGYGRWLYKSNNKTLISWALGIPVATCKEQLFLWQDAVSRITETKKRWSEIRREHDIRQSVTDYRRLMAFTRRR